MPKLTLPQLAALRAARDYAPGRTEPFTAAHQAHPHGRPGSRMRSAGVTMDSLVKRGLLARVPGKVPQLTDAGRAELEAAEASRPCCTRCSAGLVAGQVCPGCGRRSQAPVPDRAG